MAKIIWGEVMPEVTRRCQLKCPHCCRGDAQNLDMGREAVDAFLNQTAAIRILEFSGGEPTLNTEIMEYWISEMRRRNIPLGGIEVFTNAVEFSDKTKQFFKNAYEYIDYCRKNEKIFTETRTLVRVRPILVQVSRGSFHGNDVEKNFEEYRELFSAWKGCCVYRSTALPYDVGRASNIAAITKQRMAYSAIPIVDATNPHICCTELETENLIGYGDAYIPCLIVMDSYGKIFPKEEQFREYVYSDGHMTGIATLENGEYPNLLDAVRRFNVGKKPCYEQINTFRIDVVGAVAISKYTREQVGDEVPEMEISEQDERHRTILRNKYKQARLDYLMERVATYRKNFAESVKDFPGLNARFREHLRQMLDSLNSDTSIACWLNNAVTKTEYMVESDDVLDLSRFLEISELLASYYSID